MKPIMNKLSVFAVACGSLLGLAACDDQKMEWGLPEGHYAVTSSDIPIAVKEALANYGNVKDIAAQYTPQMVVGLGASADYYINSDGEHESYKGIVDDNYQMFTCGNAMKMDAMVTNSGGLNFTTVDALIDAMPSDMKLYGHNFIWHTQQKQSYLKTLIAPKLVVESNSDINNLLTGDSFDFEGGTTGSWGSWGNSSSKDVAQPGADNSNYCMHLNNPSDANAWSAQCAYTFDYYLEVGVEYTIRFDAYSSVEGGQLQFQYQNGSTYGSQGGYNTFNLTTEWATYEYTFTITSYDDVNRILLNFGAVGGDYYIDNIEFGTKVEDPMENVMTGDSYDFEGGTTGNWGSWGNSSTKDVAEPGYNNSSYCMHLNNPSDANAWSAQCAYTFDDYLEEGSKYIIQFYAKSSVDAGQLQFQYQNGSTYGSQGGYNTFTIGQDWTLCEYEFTPAYDDVNRILLNFGAVGADYYIDNVKFGKAVDQSAKQNVRKKASATSYYVIKTAAEKREALLGFMETWIKGVADHLAEKGVTPYGYDVVNEPIADGSNAPRGLNGIFGGSVTDDDGNVTYDSEPTEDTENGLNLNWGDNHFYWGYYVSDYAVKAFQYARQYLPADTKLFVNDYNLETSPAKLAALIDFVNNIDSENGSAIVDGIGTQMHIDISSVSDDEDKNAEVIAALKDKVDAMFQTLAASGKLIRVTELDVSLGTASPSSAQYEAQSDAYEMIVQSYLENIPTAQQSGITVWTLSDNADEHEYWLPDCAPNLFDSSYLRKWAYKGFCDGLAGEDLGLQYGGDDYKAYYNNGNVSQTVD